MRDLRQILSVDLEDAPAHVAERVRLFRLLVAAGQSMRGRMDLQLADAGVTTQQAQLLSVCAHADPPLAQGVVARRLGVSHQNVKQIAAALEKKGLLELVRDDDDKRIQRLRPTRAAARLFAKRNARDYEAVASWFTCFDDGEVESLVRLLARYVGERLVDVEPERDGGPHARAPRRGAATRGRAKAT